MKDFTKGSIPRHIVTMAAPIAIGTLSQLAYQFVDLYFVTKIGAAATAGVYAAGNAGLVVAALVQLIGVGTASLIAHAIGRKDRADANLVFNQSLVLSVVCGLLIAAFLCAAMRWYLQLVVADAATIEAGMAFTLCVVPAFAMTMPMTVLSSSLRAMGTVAPVIAIHMLSVVVNIILAPVLIAGWGTGLGMGVKGAGLATSISVFLGVMTLAAYFHFSQHYLTLSKRLIWKSHNHWVRILSIGLPAAGELMIMFLSAAVGYYAIRSFGPSAQAGFGIGSRIMQTLLLPGLSIGIALTPIAGQNFGARDRERVKDVFWSAVRIASAIMLATALVVQSWPASFVSMFDTDVVSSGIAILYLQLMSWSFVAYGLVCACSGMFQGFCNTVPLLITSGSQFVVFALPVAWISMQPFFRIEQVLYLNVLSISLQALVGLWLLRVEFERKFAQ